MVVVTQESRLAADLPIKREGTPKDNQEREEQHDDQTDGDNAPREEENASPLIPRP